MSHTKYSPVDNHNFVRDWHQGHYPDGWAYKPVTWVSIDDARAYCRWAGKRLPHEWEWQYAAQGHDQRKYPWGDTFDASRVPPPVTGRDLTPPADVTLYTNGSSPFGVLHAVGSVWQWTDEYVDDHTRYAVLRGGSYYHAQGSRWYFPSNETRYTLDLHNKYLLMAPSLDRAATLGFRINGNNNPLNGEPEEHREIMGLDGAIDESCGEPEVHVVSEETQEVQTLDTEVDDRDRYERKGSEEMSEAEEGGESGVGDQHKDTSELTEGGDGREGSDNCEPNEGNGALNSGDQPFVCFWPKCGKRFTYKSHLNRHKSAVHLKLKRFMCDVDGCGQQFSEKFDLNEHKNIHSGRKPYKCNEMDCGKCFAQHSCLYHKILVHLKEKRFNCDYKGCDQRFAFKKDLIPHKRLHSGEKRFACDIMDCDKRFAQKSTLNRHKHSIHLKLTSFVCNDSNCNKPFTRQYDLDHHKRVHSRNT
ncbi:unnamed protein product [Oppiella nova]|uniref:C2H2-type domain-containing protein n=1 Tax=Oppiella nova TaxID=334625 RepID=A0A7R9MJH9_9ACAR|nr:unnamed protein product [Oppiella nova]CAG2177375.1 unnamed protein product [Oppiella nova]